MGEIMMGAVVGFIGSYFLYWVGGREAREMHAELLKKHEELLAKHEEVLLGLEAVSLVSRGDGVQVKYARDKDGEIVGPAQIHVPMGPPIDARATIQPMGVELREAVEPVKPDSRD